MTGSSGAPLPARERALVGVTVLHLVFLPWAVGTMHPWSQLTSLGLALAGFFLALFPRAGDRIPGAGSPAARLLKFPLFWAGLVLLAYIVVQGVNPAWRFVSNADHWWLEPLHHVCWLPHGVDAPFSRSNPWRALVVMGSLWLLVCSVWTGLSRRRSYRILFSALVANAFLLALLGLLQQLTGADRIFWSYPSSSPSFIASFIYRNHAGAYFNLMVALAVGLACWQDQRARQRHATAGPAGLLALTAALVGLMVVLSASRLAIISLLFFAVLAGIGLIGQRRRQSLPARPRAAGWLLAAGLLAFLAVGFTALPVDRVWRRFAELAAHPALVVRDRTVAGQAAFDMLRDDWLLGWGAGCFRHAFPLYAQHYPDIYFSARHVQNYWEHAHDDLLEFPIELGLLGLLPIAFALSWSAWRLGQGRFWRNSVAFPLVLAGGLTLVHAGGDFVFQNPAVLLTWGVLLVGAVRWTELDGPDKRQSFAKP